MKSTFSFTHVKLKFQFYECGFGSLTNYKIQYNINFILLILFTVLYDAEFLILIPYLLNFTDATPTASFIFIFFVYMLFITLILDTSLRALDWQP